MSVRVALERLVRERCVVVGRDAPEGRPCEIVVVVDAEGGLHAYRNECMHIAIPLALFAESMFHEETLLCGTHGARYRLEDGYCFEGPCIGQSLERLPLEVEGEFVRIRIETP